MFRYKNKYIKVYELGLQNALEYRANFFLSLVSVIFPITIQYFLWTAVFNSTKNQTVYGYTYGQLIVYTILAGIVSKLVATGFEWEIADDIKNGGLNKFIIKPVSYFRFRIFSFLGQKTFQSAILLMLTAGIIFVLEPVLGIKIEIQRILIFCIATALALILNFLLFYGISAIAFWISEVGMLFIILSLLINIVSGGIFPLEIFGKQILFLFDFLPFKYTIFFPILIINGRLPLADAVKGLLMQGIWICVITLIANMLWRRGTKKYISVGG